MENTAVPNGRPTRRRLVEAFLGGGLFASLVSFVYPVVRYLVPPSVADLGGNEVIAAKIGDLKPNGAKLFRFGSRPGLLLRVGEGEYRAFSATCTHLSCTVQYRGDLHEIWCACHNGMYDLGGNVVSGPPPRGLQKFTVNLRGDGDDAEIVVMRT